MKNLLSDEPSLYLQQHSKQPVNWMPWGKEAFELAHKADKPLIVSIGYSACHWCHVMSKESFEEKPEMLKYSDNNIKFRHYGKILPLIIKRTIELDEGEYKDFLVFTIANHMKKSYLTWNKANVEDEVILKHLSQMSDDKLSMKETFKLSSFSDVKTQKNYKKNYSRGRNHAKRK